MKTNIKSNRFISAITLAEGAGVTVQRTIGSPSLRNYDPFMLLDHFSSDKPDEYIAGFPDHPHRGFCTFTYMLEGQMQHKDSMGNTSNLGPGDAQWMKAASGVIHSEMPQQENGLMSGFQLWINLPAANKMDAPLYQEYASKAFPIIEEADFQLKLLIGQFSGQTSPIVDKTTHVSYFDIQLQAEKAFQHQLDTGNNSFLYLYSGSGKLDGKSVLQNTLVTLKSNDNSLMLIAGEAGARFLLISGQPINQPIAQYGPFVMNTHEEIEQAMQDFQSNRFVRDRAWVKNNTVKGVRK